MALPTITDVLEYEKGQTPSSANSGGLFDVLRNSGVGKKISELANYKDPNANAGVMSPLNTKKQLTGRGLGGNLSPETKRATAGVVATVAGFASPALGHVGGVVEALAHGKSFNDYLAELDPLSAVGGRAGKQMGTTDVARRNIFAGSKSTEWDTIPRHLKFRGLDGRMKYETPDVNAKLNLGTKNATIDEVFDVAADGTATLTKSTYKGKAGDLFDHPELYKAYPHLKNANLEIVIDKTGKKSGGELVVDALGKLKINVSAADEATARHIVIHELQHGVQHAEGYKGTGNELVKNFIFTGKEIPGTVMRHRGKDPSQVDWSNIETETVIKNLELQSILRPNPLNTPETMRIQAEYLKKQHPEYLAYINNYGEAEARLAQLRSVKFKTVDELMANPVWKDGVADKSHWDVDPAFMWFLDKK